MDERESVCVCVYDIGVLSVDIHGGEPYPRTFVIIPIHILNRMFQYLPLIIKLKDEHAAKLIIISSSCAHFIRVDTFLLHFIVHSFGATAAAVITVAVTIAVSGVSPPFDV